MKSKKNFKVDPEKIRVTLEKAGKIARVTGEIIATIAITMKGSGKK